jgi:HNH endonuclease
MDAKTRQFVRRRANNRCEYCHLPQTGHEERFSVDHIVPVKHGGDDAESNLALACLRCNLSKGPNLTGLDPASGQVTSLFDPRKQEWQEHFLWNGPVLIGLTSEGRATISVMLMNVAERIHLRQSLILEGLLILGE